MARKRRKPIKYYSPKRRAVYARGEDINALEIFEEYNWTCCLCSKPIDRRLRLPNWWAATLEHLTPISKGGEHVRENVRPAHAKCNWDKADQALESYAS